jgi:hypothetical protein
LMLVLIGMQILRRDFFSDLQRTVHLYRGMVRPVSRTGMGRVAHRHVFHVKQAKTVSATEAPANIPNSMTC